MFHETRLTVRYAETDKLGIAHHSNHVIWWEMARTSLLRDMGLPYSRMEALGVACPVLEIQCRYRHPAGYEDELVVKTNIVKMTPIKIRFGYQIENCATGKLVAAGESLHAFAGVATGKPVRLDKSYPGIWNFLLEAGKPYFGEEQG